jgi:hypothetical protein
MRQIGRRRLPEPAPIPNAAALRAAATHQATGAALAAPNRLSGATTGIPKGLYRFASHAEMNRQTDEAIARAVALNSRLRHAAPYESLRPHAITIDFDGVPVRTLDIEGLLKTKQTPREKDKLDRDILERALLELKR